MNEPKLRIPPKYACLRTTTGEVLFRKDRIVLIQLMRMDRYDPDREEIKVFVVVQTADTNARAEGLATESDTAG